MQQLQMDLKINSYANKRSRRSHRKSRLGCSNCKKRRIKCDEIEPECNNCFRHSVKCDYSQTSGHVKGSASGKSSGGSVPPNEPATGFAFISSSQSGFAIPKRGHRESDFAVPQPSTPSSAVAQRPFQFTATDMILFHHCFSAEDLKDHLPDQLIRLGFSVHYLLHLLLAISGFHLNRTPAGSNNLHQFLGPDVDFSAEAERHLGIAIAAVAATDPHLHQGNSHALYVASLFIFICSLARGPQPGEYLAFRDDTDTPCLCLFAGMRSILEASNNQGISRGFSELHSGERQEETSMEREAEPEPEQNQEDSSYYKANSAASSEYSEPLQNLRSLVFNTFATSDYPRHASYCHALDLLCSRYDSVLGGPVPLSGPELWPQIFSWLYMLPDRIVHDMQEKHPVALLLFSFFSVLLYELDSVWFMHQWPRHVVNGVYRNLDDYHQAFLLWPLNRLQLL